MDDEQVIKPSQVRAEFNGLGPREDPSFRASILQTCTPLFLGTHRRSQNDSKVPEIISREPHDRRRRHSPFASHHPVSRPLVYLKQRKDGMKTTRFAAKRRFPFTRECMGVGFGVLIERYQIVPELWSRVSFNLSIQPSLTSPSRRDVV